MSAPPSSASGSCLCGAVRFTIGFPTLWCAHCHCSMCRRAHGAAYVTWVGSAAGQFHLAQGADVLVRYRSSEEALRSFCGRCGSPLFFESSRWPGEIHIAVAHFTTPLDREPEGHAYWSDHVEWGDYCGKNLTRSN